MTNPPNHSLPLPALALLLLLVYAVACGDNQTPPPQLDAYAPGSVDSLECMPDLNGRIDADQLQPAFGVPITYRLSPTTEERPVDLAGYLDRQGNRVWDFSDDHRTDQSLEVVATELDDQWYIAHYPDGQFSTVLDPDLGLDAIYSHDGSAFYLHGYASQQEDSPFGTTRVVYQEPVQVYRFPLQQGDSWTGTGVVQDSLVRGLPYTGTETYQFTVDATGRLWLPNIRFQQVLQVRTELTIDTPIGHPIYRQQIQFLFECFGEVMRLVGPDMELKEGVGPGDYIFDRAVEMRRLGF